MKMLLIAVALSALSVNAMAAKKKATKNFVGACNQQAADLAQEDFNKNNPDQPGQNPIMDLVVVSSLVEQGNANVYTVRFATFDGNQGVTIDATIPVDGDCKLAGKITSKVVGYYDGGF